MFKIGQFVRVETKNKLLSRVAMVSYIDDVVPSIDVIYSDGIQEEEAGVNTNRIIDIEDFEKDHKLEKSQNDASTLKVWGNAVFGKKDYAGAKKYYFRALQSLKPSTPIRVGNYIVVERESSIIDIFPGFVCDVRDNGSVDIISFDSALPDQDDVPRECVIFVSNKLEDWELLRSLYVNLSRCSMKLSLFGWAIKWSCRALATSDLLSHYEEYKLETNQAKLVKQRSDAIYLRGLALLSANRLKLAHKDYYRLDELKDTRASALLAAINECLNRRRRLNKHLARDIAAWLKIAMGQHGNSRVENGNCDDLDLPSEEDNNEDCLVEEFQNMQGQLVLNSAPKYVSTPSEQPVDMKNEEAIILKTRSSSLITPILSSLVITLVAMTVAACFVETFINWVFSLIE